MPGLIESNTGLTFGAGLNWLEGGLGDDGLEIPNPPSSFMLTENGNRMITEDGNPIITE